MDLPTRHQHAVDRWKELVPAWDIAEEIGIPIADLLQHVEHRQGDFPTLDGGAYIERSPRRGRPRTSRRWQLPPRPPRPKPMFPERELDELDLGLIARFVHLSIPDTRRFLLAIFQGDNLYRVGEAFDLSWHHLRPVADHLGWSLSWRVLGRNRKMTVGSMSVEEVIRRHLAGETLQAIGDLAGVTRERIRQIIKREGQPEKMTIIRAKAKIRDAALAEDRARRRAIREERSERLHELAKARFLVFIEPARQAWANGATIESIAKQYGAQKESNGLAYSSGPPVVWCRVVSTPQCTSSHLVDHCQRPEGQMAEG
ncbi:MAG: sigma factor-like helix-turn-helix DNA-binding protein [Paludibaculum sp.]